MAAHTFRAKPGRTQAREAHGQPLSRGGQPHNSVDMPHASHCGPCASRRPGVHVRAPAVRSAHQTLLWWVALLAATPWCGHAVPMSFSSTLWSGVGAAASGLSPTTSTWQRLADAASPSKGALWYRTLLPVRGAFQVSFEFSVSQCNSITPADGICMAMQRSSISAIGDHGGNLGLIGIPPWAAVCFDVYSGDGGASFSTDVYKASEYQYALPPTGANTFSASTVDISAMSMTVMYNASTQLMNWSIASMGATQFFSSMNAGNLTAELGAPRAYFGFTASTGGAYCQFDVGDVDFSFDCPPPDGSSVGATLTRVSKNNFTVDCGEAAVPVSASVRTTEHTCSLMDVLGCTPVTPTPTPSAPATPTTSASTTPTSSLTPTPSSSMTTTPTGTTTPTPSGTTTPSASVSPTTSTSVTATPSASSSNSASGTPSSSSSITPTASSTQTGTPSSSVTPSATNSASTSATPTQSGTASRSGTLTPSASATPTVSTSASRQRAYEARPRGPHIQFLLAV